MTSTFDLMPLDATFGAVINGVKLSKLDDAEWHDLQAAWVKYALLIFPGQYLSRHEQIAFANRFGPLEIDITAISNLNDDGSVRVDQSDDRIMLLKGNLSWHADSTFGPVQAKGAVFSAEVVPSSGGQTGWADMSSAYDALDDVLRSKVDHLTARHSIRHSQTKLGFQSEYRGYTFNEGSVPLRPLVKVHPKTGRKSLLIGRHAHNVSGMDEAESERFLKELEDFACRPPRVYYHNWSAGDVVVWDNLCLLHRLIPWNMTEPRVMWHSRMAGDRISEAALE